MWTPEDVEIRRNALALHKAWRAAEEAYNASDERAGNELSPEAWAEIRAADAEYYEKTAALRQENQARHEEIEKKYAKAPMPLKAAMDEAEKAYLESEGSTLREDDDGNAVICASSGLPIWSDELTLSDEWGDDIIIRAAAGLPPRPVEDEDVEEAA